MYALKHLLLSALSIKTITAWPSQSFKTVPFTPPTFNVTKSGEALAPGLLFLTTTSPPNPAAVIMTNNGELVWSSEAGTFGNFNLQTLHSTPVLTYWSSPSPPTLGYGYGKVHILDSLYQPMYIISPNLHLVRPVGSDSDIDGHEAYMTDRGTLLVTAYNITEADLTSVNGPANGYALDCLLFEIDVQTQEVLFSWSALQAGIPISDTQMPLGTAGTFENPFDWFHINSIQDVGDRYLVNSRHLWTVYMINAKGEIEWQFKVRPLVCI